MGNPDRQHRMIERWMSALNADHYEAKPLEDERVSVTFLRGQQLVGVIAFTADGARVAP